MSHMVSEQLYIPK